VKVGNRQAPHLLESLATKNPTQQVGFLRFASPFPLTILSQYADPTASISSNTLK